MNIDNKLDALKKIKTVDAPPFLLTRIKQRIQNLENVPAPVKWKFGFVASALIIIVLNVSVFLKSGSTTNNSGIDTVVSTMNLTNTNELYHE